MLLRKNGLDPGPDGANLSGRMHNEQSTSASFQVGYDLEQALGHAWIVIVHLLDFECTLLGYLELLDLARGLGASRL